LYNTNINLEERKLINRTTELGKKLNLRFRISFKLSCGGLFMSVRGEWGGSDHLRKFINIFI